MIAICTFTDALSFETAEEALHYGVDAPMSSNMRRIGQIGEDERVQLSYDIALQAAVDFLIRHAFLRPTFNVRPGTWIAAHANHRNSP